MNDIREQTPSFFECFHESDWEHVSVRLNKIGDVFTPDNVNFYTHDGGKTYSANDCWWSSSNVTSYSNIQQGYDESHTHLHIWLAANAHASYNRYSLVLRSMGRALIGFPLIDYVDRLDYNPSGYDLYFPYDQLINLGEVSKKFTVKCPDSGYWLEFHSYPISTQSKHWLAYRGKLGDFSHTGPPFMPAKEAGYHEWISYTIASNFGNTGWWYGIFEMEITWVPDDLIGD